jgi:hypothetical protein
MDQQQAGRPILPSNRAEPALPFCCPFGARPVHARPSTRTTAESGSSDVDGRQAPLQSNRSREEKIAERQA